MIKNDRYKTTPVGQERLRLDNHPRSTRINMRHRKPGTPADQVRPAKAASTGPDKDQHPTRVGGSRLSEWPRMPATVVAQRIGWQHSLTTLKDRLRLLRPEFLGVDPVDRTVYEPGEIVQCDLWFPAVKIPVGPGQDRVLPVLVMALGFSRSIAAVMIPSRQAGDILSGMWQLINGWGRCPKTLVWDREAAIGGTGRVSAPAAAFAGTLATRILLAPPRDPEFKGLVERVNGFLESSFLPGHTFTSPDDFNTQLESWLPLANQRTVRSIGARPVDVFETDYQAMVPLPPTVPPIGLSSRIRLARDYYVRVDTVDYSVDPKVIGRFVDVTATLSEVVVFCDGKIVARHPRSWAKQGVVTDPAHRERARQLRQQHADLRRQPARHHADGHVVALRALPDYDALFGVDFNPNPEQEVSNQ